MAFLTPDRVQQVTSTTGTGPYTLGAPVEGFRRMSDVRDVRLEDVFHYTVTDNVDWEVALGAFGGDFDTITRLAIISSSIGNAFINWGPGDRTFFISVSSVLAQEIVDIENKLDDDANAVSASRWFNARTITFTGDVTASFSLDGSSNISTTLTVANNSHTHTTANVSGLDVALAGKLSTTGTAATSATVINIRTGGALRVWSGTQAQYTALSPDNNTLYFVE